MTRFSIQNELKCTPLRTNYRDCLLGAIEVTDDVATTGCPVAEETGCDGSLLDREVKAVFNTYNINLVFENFVTF